MINLKDNDCVVVWWFNWIQLKRFNKLFHQLFYFKEISQWLIEFDCSSILSLMKLLLCSFGYFDSRLWKIISIHSNSEISKKSHLNHSIIKWINFNQFDWIWNEWDYLLNYFYSNQFERIYHFRSVWSSNIFSIDSIHQLRWYSII